MYLKLLLVAIVLLAIAFLGMGISIILKKNGRFPVTSIGKNKEMAKRGISCPKSDELKCHSGTKGQTGCGC